jgi:PEGA domain-containing protein
MKSVVVAASYLAASVFLASPLAAQEPEPPPPPAQADVAVKRSTEPARVPGANRSPAAARGRDAEPAPDVSRAPDRAVERPAREVRIDAAPPPREVVSDSGARSAASVSAEATADDQRAQQRGAVRRPPTNEGGRTVDRAVPRSSVPTQTRIVRTHPHYYYPSYRRYYDPWGYGSFGLGYFYYSPWAWGAPYYNYGYGAYYPYAYGGYPYANGGYPYAYGGGYDLGSVRIKVEPRDAEVWVDGYFAGSVDDFDGTFQSLKLETGPYRIEIRKPGYETLSFDVRVQPGRTITFRGELRATP